MKHTHNFGIARWEATQRSWR